MFHNFFVTPNKSLFFKEYLHGFKIYIYSRLGIIIDPIYRQRHSVQPPDTQVKMSLK